jgi:predicted ATPase
MRVAFTGTHRSGKSTLVELLSEHLPDYGTVEEPYHLMEEEGYEFSDPPTIEDFEAQLDRSIAAVLEAEPDVLFDRCPVDLLGYLAAHDDSDAFDLDEWLPRVRQALREIDLLVFVPVEAPDRIALGASEDEGLRAAVDEALRSLLVDDPYDLGVEILEVEGPPEARAKLVMNQLRRLDPTGRRAPTS